MSALPPPRAVKPISPWFQTSEAIPREEMGLKGTDEGAFSPQEVARLCCTIVLSDTDYRYYLYPKHY